MSKRPIVYVSCPYTHPDPEMVKGRLLVFAKYVGAIERGGQFHAVSALFNQMLLDRGIDLPTDYGFWQSYSRTLIRVSSRVYVLDLPDWEDSVGVKDEIEFARIWGKPVDFASGWQP